MAIAVSNPMPQGPVNFMAIYNVLDDFLRNIRGIGFRSAQPCPFGQAYVRFNLIFEKELLIQTSPHQYGNGMISFISHNCAWNNRTAMMTHEVWIMMLGLNLDLWTQPLIDKVVSSFGRLLIWEEDNFYQSRAVVKVRVSSLEDIPWFFVFTEGTDFESDSWSVQCEILQAQMLGGAPQDEDFPSDDDDDFYPHEFHFHGFGQPRQGPPPPPRNFPIPPDDDALGGLGWGQQMNNDAQEQPQHFDVPDLLDLVQEATQGDQQHAQQNPLEEIIQALVPNNEVPAPPVPQ